MKDSEIQTILNGFKNYFRLRKILSYFCYFLIFILLSFYFSNFFEKKRTVRIVSQLNDKQKNLNAEKVMTNPRITIKHDDPFFSSWNDNILPVNTDLNLVFE